MGAFKPSLPKITSSAVRKPIVDPDAESIDRTFESASRESVSGAISSDFDCNTFIVNESVNTSLSLGMSAIELEIPQEKVEHISLPLKEVHKLVHIPSNLKGNSNKEASQRSPNSQLTMPSSCRMDRTTFSLETNSSKKSSLPSLKAGLSRTSGLAQSKSSGTLRKPQVNTEPMMSERSRNGLVDKISCGFEQAYVSSGSKSKLIKYDALCNGFSHLLGRILKELGVLKHSKDREEVDRLWKALGGERRGGVLYDSLRRAMLSILGVAPDSGEQLGSKGAGGYAGDVFAVPDARELAKSFKAFYLNRNDSQMSSFGRPSSVKMPRSNNTRTQAGASTKTVQVLERPKAKQVLKSFNFNAQFSRNKQSKSLTRTQVKNSTHRMNDSHCSNRQLKTAAQRYFVT